MKRTVRPLKARITAHADVTRVDVYDDIGEGGWFSEGLTAKSFANQIAAVTGPLEVHINSGGGDVWDGISIKNAIEAHTGKVTTVVDGIAASIASVIAQAGAERVMMPGSMMMIHEASTYTYGNAAELAKDAQTLDEVSGNLAAIYARKAGGTAEAWRDAMRQETWYTAEQAVEAGLADRTGDGAAALPAGMDLDAFADGMPGQIAAQLRALPRTELSAKAAETNSAGQVATAGQKPAQGTHQPEQQRVQVTVSAPQADAELVEALRTQIRQDPKAKAVQAILAAGYPVADGAAALASTPRVLGVESMPIVDKALPVHHTATVDEAWDGPAAVAAMPNDDKVLRYCHAWMSDEAAAEPSEEGDDDADDKKESYRFPHHKTEGGPANLNACRNGLARLEGSTIPESDKPGVRAHLQAHLDDAHDDEGDEDTKDEADQRPHAHADVPAWLTPSATAPLPAWLTHTTAEEATQ